MSDGEATGSVRGAGDSRNDSDLILELRNVSVEFAMDRGSSRVVDDVSIGVRENEILGIIGESGSGKSMLASSMLDAVVPPGQTDGEVWYHPDDGEPYDVLDLDDAGLASYRWEEVSMVFQGAMSSFNPTMKIAGHFRETIDRHGASMDEGMERARQLLEDLHLDPDRVLASYAHELSGGMRQRALLALSLVLDPDVVVMDEPTAALDLLMQRAILTLLEDLKEDYDLTIVFITHDLPLVTDLADRMGVMYAFDVVELGPTDEILRGPAHPYTRALLKSTPSLETVTEEMQTIDGSAPDPVDPPAGCSFHPRCPLADEQCRAEEPPMFEAGPDHRSSCFYQDSLDERMPMEAIVEDR